MLKKFASLMLVFALICTLGTFAFASTQSDPELDSVGVSAALGLSPVTRTKAKPNEKLRADMLKLVADAKAGKVALAERPQIQPAKSNNLSKRTKIAIGVGIAIAVVAVILIAKSPALNDGR
jgi:hypothetical protein